MKEISGKSVNRVLHKILFVNLEGQISGAEKSLLLNIKHLSSGFLPQVACPETSALADQLRAMGVQIVSLPRTPVKWNSFFVWMVYYCMANLKIFWLTIRNRPKLIHANTTKAALTVLLAVSVMRIKLLWHVRDAECPGWVLRICSIFSLRIIAVSQAIRHQLVKNGVENDKIEVVHNSIDLIQAKPHMYDARPQGPIVFANIGQFVPWKKQVLFIEAAEAYLDKGRQAMFLIVGGDVFGRDGQYAQMLQNRVKNSRFSGSFQIIPWQKNLNPTWERIDCLVHTADKEPFGRVVVEAMERRIPVIAADAFGPSEILDDCITGFLFEPDDVHELCCCMEIVSQNPAHIREVTLAGYQYVCCNHDIRINIGKIQTIYLRLLAA